VKALIGIIKWIYEWTDLEWICCYLLLTTTAMGHRSDGTITTTTRRLLLLHMEPHVLPALYGMMTSTYLSCRGRGRDEGKGA